MPRLGGAFSYWDGDTLHPFKSKRVSGGVEVIH